MPSSGDPSSSDQAVRDGMERLIAGLKDRAPRDLAPQSAPSTNATLPPNDADDDLADAPWSALSPAELEPSSPPLARGSIIGRHVVLDELGAGGMGVVHAAYDPELDRKVALKLLRPGWSHPNARTRLLREAQALAKLSHPNVVAIHDVGTVADQVWLAMEFVQGQTLSAWLKAPRTWREVLGVMRHAGEGLAAAHAVGLLHRDFKPDNVMVGDDGRVRVMDFGLARARSRTTESESDERVPTVDTMAMDVTREGAIVGTPGYMAPEQLGNATVTAAADQFAFCVTLWEALYGEAPFGGRTWMEIVSHVLAGRLRAPKQRRAAPSWLRRACERGLAVDPQQRWPSMHALLDTLAKGRTRARARKGLAAVGVLALMGASGEGYRRYDVVVRTARCELGGDELEATWTDERRAALHDALVGTGVAHAAQTAEKTTAYLDRQAAAWRVARVEACLDTNVRGDRDAQALERSLWCLDERRMQVESLVDELVLADAGVVQKAVPAAAGLDSIEACRDEDMLRSLIPPPPEQREAVRAVQSEVTRAYNLMRAGRYERGHARAREALARAEALQWRPLVAAARLQLGRLLSEQAEYARAEQTLEDAYFESLGGVAPGVAFDAATELVRVVGDRLARHAEGRRWGRHARSVSTEHSGIDSLRRARLLTYLAYLDEATGAYDDARASYEQALALYEDALGPSHLTVGSSLHDLAIVHFTTGDYAQAKHLHEQALAIREQALGPDHPTVAASLNNLATVELALGAYERARELQERALTIYRATLEPNHPNIASTLGNLANSHYVAGRLDRAIELYSQALDIGEQTYGPEHPNVAQKLHNLASMLQASGADDEASALYERALAIYQEALGPDHATVAMVLNNLGFLHYTHGRYDEAKALHEQALAIYQQTLGPEHVETLQALTNVATDHWALGNNAEAQSLHERVLESRQRILGTHHPSVADTLTGLADIHRTTGDLEQAVAAYERALAIFEDAHGPEHHQVGFVLVRLAEIELDQHRPENAVTLAERALAIHEGNPAAVAQLPRARVTLARALWDAPEGEGRDRERAVSLAEQNRSFFRSAGPESSELLASTERWLAEHRVPPR